MLEMFVLSFSYIAISECFCFAVIGCADIKVPMYAWYKREGDDATMGCENQDLTWTLKCEGNRWSGVVGNCTDNGRLPCTIM